MTFRSPLGYDALSLLGRDAPNTASRFRRWRGRSGQTYPVSVFPIWECPDFDEAVILVVNSVTGSLVWIGAAETSDDLRSIRTSALEAGGDEIHVHLLAGMAAAREAIVRDIAAPH